MFVGLCQFRTLLGSLYSWLVDGSKVRGVLVEGIDGGRF